MKNISVFFLYWIALFGVACNDWLDEKPDRSLVVPKTMDDYYSLLNNGTVLNNSYPILGQFATNSYYVTDESFNSMLDWQRNAYTWTEMTPYIVLSDWNSTYSKIFLCNLVLEGMKTIQEPKAESERLKYNSIIGQAYFFRGKCYFELSQIWAKPYDPNSENNDLTIPIRTNTDFKEKFKNSKVIDLYNLIISDLSSSAKYLPMTSEYFTRPNKLASWALFSRLYLCMSKFEDSKRYSDSLLNAYGDLMNYNSVTKVGTYPFNKMDNMEIIFYNTLFATSSNKLIIDSNLISKFDTNDLRRDLFFKYNSQQQASFIGSYAGNSLLFGGLAVDEIYLNRAESNARLGNLNNAVNDLNILLKNRFIEGTYKEIKTSIQQDSLIKLIIEERRKELIFRGIRWYDERRLTNSGEFNETQKRFIKGTEYLLEPGSYKYTFPIPQSAIEGTSLKQIDGWN